MSAAAMIVHSFSPTDEWFDDFFTFAQCLGSDPTVGKLEAANVEGGDPLNLGWARGEHRFLDT